jgi:hypothetical protein
LLALLDDAATAGPVIEMSSALAQHLRRPLEVVYVESAAALLAAALPFARVLAAGGGQWQPFAPQDVELAYRSQAARLRALVERVTVQRTVEWSMRVVRGALPQTALELQPLSDLMLVGSGGSAATATTSLGASHRPRARSTRIVTVITDDSPAGQHARTVAGQVARALDGVLVELNIDERTGAPADPLRCELLVLPRALLTPSLLARLAQPALLVG